MHLRFSIRDLLWLTALVALAVGWFLDHRRRADQSRPAYTIYYVKHVNPNFALKVLQTTSAGAHGITLGADARLNAIVVQSSKSHDDEIEAILSTLDQDPNQPVLGN